MGYGQLAWKLRLDPRVVVIERTNIRHLAALPDGELADLAVIDASFIGLRQVLPPTLGLLQAAGQVIALIKPQFEAGREGVGKGGVVRSAEVHRSVLKETIALAGELALTVAGLTVSPAPGPAGNVEFLIWLRRSGDVGIDIAGAIDEVLAAAAVLRK